MGFLSKFLNIGNSSKEKQKNTNDSYNSEVKRCMIELKLTKAEYKLFSIAYYRGATSYKTFFRNVFMRKSTKILQVIKEANKKSASGCNIDFTFVRFYKDNQEYIDIPFEVFSEKRDMRLERRNMKMWNKENLKRLIVKNPELRNFDEEMIREAIYDVFNEYKKIENMVG